MTNSLRFARTSLVLLTLGALCVPTTATAVDFRMELAPKVSIPLGPLLDGMPVDVRALNVRADTALFDFQNSTGGGFSLSFLINEFEIRYDLTAIPFERLDLTHLSVTGTNDVLQVVSPTQSVDISDDYDAMIAHHLTFGYRFTPFDWKVRPYFPAGFGAAVLQLRNDADTVYGFTLNLGVGVEWLATDRIRVGAGFKYVFSAYTHPDLLTTSSLQSNAQQAANTNSSFFESVLETQSLIDIYLHAAFVF